MNSERAIYCPICKGNLERRGQLVKTIKAEFVRVFKACEKCGVRVMLFTLPRPR